MTFSRNVTLSLLAATGCLVLACAGMAIGQALVPAPASPPVADVPVPPTAEPPPPPAETLTPAEEPAPPPVEPTPDRAPELPVLGDEPVPRSSPEIPRWPSTPEKPLRPSPRAGNPSGDRVDPFASKPSPRNSQSSSRSSTGRGKSSGTVTQSSRRSAGGHGEIFGGPFGGVVREDPLKDVKNAGDLVSLTVEKLNQADRYLESQTQVAARGYKDASDQPQRDKFRAELATLIQKHFEVRHAIRQKEIADLEAQVQRLRGLLQKRKQAQKNIVDMRLQQFVRTADGLGWDASLGGGGGSPFSTSSSSPARGFGVGMGGMIGGPAATPPRGQPGMPGKTPTATMGGMSGRPAGALPGGQPGIRNRTSAAKTGGAGGVISPRQQ